MDNLFETIRKQVMEKMDFSRDLTDAEIDELILQELALTTKDLHLGVKE